MREMQAYSGFKNNGIYYTALQLIGPEQEHYELESNARVSPEDRKMMQVDAGLHAFVICSY